MKNERHNQSRSQTYRRWNKMKQRIAGVYKGKVTMCDRWKSYTAFVEDMGVCPAGYTLDRIDNRKGYEPGNCRWVTMADQYRNRTNNVWVTLDGETKILSEWSKQYGIDPHTAYQRIAKGFTPLEALTLSRYQHRKSISKASQNQNP